MSNPDKDYVSCGWGWGRGTQQTQFAHLVSIELLLMLLILFYRIVVAPVGHSADVGHEVDCVDSGVEM